MADIQQQITQALQKENPMSNVGTAAHSAEQIERQAAKLVELIKASETAFDEDAIKHTLYQIEGRCELIKIDLEL